MDRPIISVFIMLLLASLGLDPAFAARNAKITISGNKEAVTRTVEVLEQMQKRLIEQGRLMAADVDELVTRSESHTKPAKRDAIIVYSPKGVIEPFTKAQQKYVACQD